jgi:pimeloyl-ACP methyl ester carboxylesterase
MSEAAHVALPQPRPVVVEAEPVHVPAALAWSTRLAVLTLLLLLAVRMLNAASLFPRMPVDTSRFGALAAKTPNTREVRFEATDGTRLYGWVTGRDDAPRKIVFCCGNGGNVSGYGLRMAEIAQALNAQTLVFDYRGYYLSEGSPSEDGCKRDVRGAWLYATIKLGWKPEQTVIWGHSLGSAFATSLASDLETGFGFGDTKVKPARALILESPLTSAADMALRQFGFLGAPHWLVYADLDNLSRVKKLKLPIFVMHGTLDEIIPFEMGKEVAAACGAKSLWIEGGNHNGLWTLHHEQMLAGLSDFLRE